jgi:hypothetical protein
MKRITPLSEAESTTSEGPFSEQSVQRAEAVLKELLGNIATHYYRNNELVSAAIYATALRRLSPDYNVGEVNPHNTFLHGELNRRFGMDKYLYEAADALLQSLINRLAQHGISDSGQSPQRDDPAGAP